VSVVAPAEVVGLALPEVIQELMSTFSIDSVISEIPVEEEFDPRAMHSLVGMEAMAEFDDDWFADSIEGGSPAPSLSEPLFSAAAAVTLISPPPHLFGPLPSP